MERLHLLLPALGPTVRAVALQECNWDEERALTMLRRFQVSKLPFTAPPCGPANMHLHWVVVAGRGFSSTAHPDLPEALQTAGRRRWPKWTSCPSCTRSGGGTRWRCRAASWRSGGARSRTAAAPKPAAPALALTPAAARTTAVTAAAAAATSAAGERAARGSGAAAASAPSAARRRGRRGGAARTRSGRRRSGARRRRKRSAARTRPGPSSPRCASADGADGRRPSLPRLRCCGTHCAVGVPGFQRHHHSAACSCCVLQGVVGSEYGRYGIIRETDMYSKRPEFQLWAMEVHGPACAAPAASFPPTRSAAARAGVVPRCRRLLGTSFQPAARCPEWPCPKRR